MSCKGFLQFLLEVINFLFLLVGLALVGYGIYLVVTYNSSSSLRTSMTTPSDASYLNQESFQSSLSLSPSHDKNDFKYKVDANNLEYKVSSPISPSPSFPLIKLKRSLLRSIQQFELPLSSSYWDYLPYTWFLYLILFLGAIITLIACSGYIAASTAYESCLHCYSLFLVIAIATELSIGAFISLNGSWKKIIPTDSTGQLDILEEYIEDRIDIFKWIALAIMIIQVLALLLTIILKALSCDSCWGYDSDEEYLSPRIIRQSLLNGRTYSGINRSINRHSNRSSLQRSRSPILREGSHSPILLRQRSRSPPILR